MEDEKMKKFTKRITSGCKKIPLGAGAVKASVAAITAVIVTVASHFNAYAGELPTLDLPDITTGFVGNILVWIFNSIWILGLAIAGFGAVNFFISLATKDATQKSDSFKWMLAGGGISVVGVALAAAI